MKVTRVHNIIPLADRKRKKQVKEDYKRHLNRGPEPPKGA